MNTIEKLKKVLDALQPPWSATLVPDTGLTAPELKGEKTETSREVPTKYPPDLIRRKHPSGTAGDDVELPQNGLTPETRESRTPAGYLKFEIAIFSYARTVARPSPITLGGA